MLFTFVLTVPRIIAHSWTQSCGLFLTFRGKNTHCLYICYMHKNVCGVIALQSMLTRARCLGHTDTIFVHTSPMLQLDCLVWGSNGTCHHVRQMSLGSQPSLLTCQWTPPLRPTLWTHTNKYFTGLQKMISSHHILPTICDNCLSRGGEWIYLWLLDS